MYCISSGYLKSGLHLEVPSCPPCPVMANTLHNDIHKVIDTMGPPTPMFPLDLGCESADETTNSSTHSDETENNTVTNNSSNTSFVEVHNLYYLFLLLL